MTEVEETTNDSEEGASTSSMTVKPGSLNEMGKINKEIYAAGKWGYKPYFQTSHDSFMPHRSYKELEYKMPIMNYLKQSLSLLENCSKQKDISKDDQDILRRPLPLHKRPDIMLRDLLSIETKEENTEVFGKTIDEALTFNQLETLDNHLDAIKEATKISVENLDVKPDLDPIVIPSVPVLNSDSESDSDSVSIVAFDLKDANLGDTEVEDVCFNDYIELPKPIVKPSSFEFYLPTEKTKTKRANTKPSTFVARNVYPQIDMINTSQIIKGKLGRVKQTQSGVKIRANLSTPPVVNFGGAEFEQNHRAFSDRTAGTCDYFNRLEMKQKYLKAKKSEEQKISYSVNQSKNIHDVRETVKTMKGQRCFAFTAHENDEENAHENDEENAAIPLDEKSENKATKYVFDEKIEGIHFTDILFHENIWSEDKTKKVNNPEFEGNIKSHKKKNSDYYNNNNINTDSLYAIHYLTGSEIYEKKLIPRRCNIVLNCEQPRREKVSVKVPAPTVHKKNTNDRKISVTNVRPTSRIKNVRKLKSAPIRANNIKKGDIDNRRKQDSKVCTSARNESSTNNVKAEEMNSTNTDIKCIPAIKIFSLSKKNAHRKKKTSLNINKPPVTMVSMTNSNPVKDKIKNDSIKKNPLNTGVSTPPNRPNKLISNESKVDVVQKSVSHKVITFPDEHLKHQHRPNSVPYKPVRKCDRNNKRACSSVASSIDRFKYNEYRDIQNKLREDNIIVSVNMIKKVLVEPRENKSEAVKQDYRLAPLSSVS